MVAQVIGIGVDEWLRIAFVSLREVVVCLRQILGDLVRQVQEPEPDREEGQLDEVGDEIVISGQQILGEIIRPVYHVFLF